MKDRCKEWKIEKKKKKKNIHIIVETKEQLKKQCNEK